MITLSATATTGNTLLWYIAATGGVGSTTVPVVSTSSAGTFTYYVSQRNAALVEGPRAAITVLVKPVPLAPTVSSPNIYCLNATSTILNATADAGNNLLWYNAATGGLGSVNIPTTVTSISGIANYYVSQTNAGGCESPRALISVNIIAPPVAPNITAAPYTKLFPGISTTISAASGPTAGNTYAWFKNGITLAGQTGNATVVNMSGNYTLRVTNSNGCVGSSNTIAILDSAKQNLFVYPNPSTGKFQVRYFSDNTNLKPRKITIYNAAGAQVYTASFVMFGAYTPMDIDLSKNGAGTYFIHLMDNDGKNLVTQTIFIY